MANPAGEADRAALKLDFDRRLILQFRGSAITALVTEKRPFAGLAGGQPGRLAANVVGAIEFCCGGTLQGRRISPNPPGIRGNVG